MGSEMCIRDSNISNPLDLSGLFASFKDIQEIRQGEVALLKGEGWVGNEGAGLVHRSPQLKNNEKRLLLSLDFPTQ